MTQPISVIVASCISAVTAIIASVIANRFSIREIKSELQAEYRSELAKKQLEASEAFWEIFASTSMTDGEHRIVRNFASSPMLDVQEAKTFVATFNDTFASKAGLYLAKSTRRKLHAFRDNLLDLLASQSAVEDYILLGRAQADKIKDLRTKARLSLREQLGTANLTVARTEYSDFYN